MKISELTDAIYDKVMDNSHSFDLSKVKNQWVNRDHGVIRLDYKDDLFFLKITKNKRKDLLSYFGVSNFDQLSKDTKFRELLNSIVEVNDGKLVSWRPTNTGFLVIMESQMNKYSLINGEIKCTVSSLLYK